MKNVLKKKTTKIILPMKHLDYSHVKPPARPAIEAMLQNLHNAADKDKGLS